MSARAEFNEEEIEGLPFDPEIEIFVGTSYGGDYPFPPLNRIDDCFMTNWKAPKLREGWGRFKSYYEIEWYYAGYHFIDTSRSLVKMLYRVCEGNNEGSRWPACDFISHLTYDLRRQRRHREVLTKAEEMMLMTVFPLGLSEFMEHSYQKWSLPERLHLGEPRVLNHPWFYHDRNAPMGRLVEIAVECGRTWALDRTKPIPSPEVLAEEIALLCYAMDEPHQVASARDALLPVITEQMELYRLVPNVWQ
jgi:hypothetical protein